MTETIPSAEELDLDPEYRVSIKGIRQMNFLEVNRYIVNFMRENGPDACMKDGELTEEYKFLIDLQNQLSDECNEFKSEYDRGMARLFYWWVETHSPYLTDDWGDDDIKYFCAKFDGLTGLPELHVIFTTDAGMKKMADDQEELKRLRESMKNIERDEGWA